MANCNCRYIDEFTVDGIGKTKDEAEKDFDKRLDDKLTALRAEAKCDEKMCPIADSAPGDDTSYVCLFSYTELGERKSEEKEREVKVFFNKKWVTTKLKRWECTQKFKYGCFCFEKTVGDGK